MGRSARGVLAVAYRCAHGVPAVVQTAPKLADGTPFPTMFYLSCSALTAAASRMESDGLMREMTDRLAVDTDLAAAYRRAHEAYLAVRNNIADLGIAVSAGGMPDRVKCLHVLLGHTLSVGRGVNPLGDEALDLLGDYARGEVCAHLPGGEQPAPRMRGGAGTASGPAPTVTLGLHRL
ncbi:MAG: DUF501 domain-containing protein [Nakamurella sp.]